MIRYYQVDKKTGKRTGWCKTYGFAMKTKTPNEKVVKRD